MPFPASIQAPSKSPMRARSKAAVRAVPVRARALALSYRSDCAKAAGIASKSTPLKAGRAAFAASIRFWSEVFICVFMFCGFPVTPKPRLSGEKAGRRVEVCGVLIQ